MTAWTRFPCALPRGVSELRDGLIRTYDLTPDQLLGRRAEPENLVGGDPAVNAEITREVLGGGKGPKRDVVVVNAAAALMAAGMAGDFPEAVRQAEASIDTGAAAAKLAALVRFTNENG